jgi:hypothetical protein
MVRNLQNGILRNAYQKSVIRHDAVFVRKTNYLAQLKESLGLQRVKGTARARRPLLEAGGAFTTCRMMRRRFNTSASLRAYGITSFAGFEKSVATRIVRLGCAAVLMFPAHSTDKVNTRVTTALLRREPSFSGQHRQHHGGIL